MDCLPLEILVEIFSELRLKDLLVSKLVCKGWYNFISVDHLVWRVVCMKKWVGRCNVAFYGGSWKRMLLDDNLRTKALEWEWNVKQCGPGIHTFHNNRAALFGDSKYSACQVLCSRPCTDNEKFFIEFEIINTTCGAINIGVSGKNADIERRCGFDSNGWSYSLYSDAFFHNQAWSPRIGHVRPTIGAGTRIGMGIDMKKKCITFFFNGINQGMVKEGLPDIVYPSISLGDVGDCIAIVPDPVIPKF